MKWIEDGSICYKDLSNEYAISDPGKYLKSLIDDNDLVIWVERGVVGEFKFNEILEAIKFRWGRGYCEIKVLSSSVNRSSLYSFLENLKQYYSTDIFG